MRFLGRNNPSIWLGWNNNLDMVQVHFKQWRLWNIESIYNLITMNLMNNLQIL